LSTHRSDLKRARAGLIDGPVGDSSLAAFRWNQVMPENGEGEDRYRHSPDEEKQGAGVK
jgi:hypothetical protein